jgi:hypothetical protein
MEAGCRTKAVLLVGVLPHLWCCCCDGVIVKSGVWSARITRCFSAILLRLTGLIDDGDCILKPDTSCHIGQVLQAPELPLPHLYREPQLKYQAQQRISRHAVLSPGRSQPNRGEAQFDRVVVRMCTRGSKANRDFQAPFYQEVQYYWLVSCQAYGPRSGIGHFRAIPRPEALCFGAFWRLERARAYREGRLRGLNRPGGMGSAYRSIDLSDDEIQNSSSSSTTKQWPVVLNHARVQATVYITNEARVY